MILASQSPRRIELMDEAGFTCRVIPANIDETPHEGEQPLDLVGRLAKDKALCVASEHARAGEIVVAADTIVTIDGSILGKPAVTFYALDEDTIEAYARSGEPLDKAGAYGIQGKGGRMLVEKIDGDFYNVVGLPIARVARTIRDMQQD